MNKAVVVFLKSDSHVNQLTVSGIWVREAFVTITPLSAPATKIIISNVPPFITNETITKELQRFGKITSPVRMIPLGCKNNALKHVLSFRRQVFMFLNSPDRTLEVSFRVNHGENSYMVYASTENLKCYECGVLGHKRFACPHKDDQRASTSREDVNDTDQRKSESEEQGTEEQDEGPTEEGKIQEVSEMNVCAVSVEQAGCSSVPDKHGDVTDGIEKREAQSGVENVCEVKDVAQADNLEENMVEEVDSLSQYTDDGVDEEQWTEGSRGTDQDLYTVEEINAFLDKTKGKAGVEVSHYFPDIEKFTASVMWARKVNSIDELSQQKRYRLKKHLTGLRQGKKTGKARGKTKS
ncbi:zinc finger CCHC-type and RNA-binding motif-containing protein 1-like [Carassius auratus]|uniref:Zinc finger CCHC-type and RNA-binding motif-containing protein 1-like n=1 Tax=Carassius auratus TaxID=7957 RepID=A0A6P6NN03_CARAU|nr:zinc finger CCHC-type and RNA-binding motif-containing protein 1-like [Carassius auratus]